MELTHILKRKTGSHTEHREEWDAAINFTYTVNEDHPSYTYPYVAEDRRGSWWLYHYRTDGEWSKRCVSNPQTLTTGTYKAIVNNENHKLILFRLESYEDNARMYKIGEYSDGDRIEISTAGQHVLLENDYQGFDDMSYSLKKLIREYDEEVIDYITTPIDEPIGWDDLKMSMKRNDYHGMGAEVSMGNLDFYGKAFYVVETAYNDDIDSEVLYIITSGSTTIYSGQVDLTTCSFVRGDYESVKAKVGEVGVMTTFNNRTKTDIDLTDQKTVDGESIDTPSWLSLNLPMKHLLYTNIGKQKADTTIPASGTINIGGSKHYLVLPFADDILCEFGKFEFQGEYCTDSKSNITAQYDTVSGDTDKYGSNTTAYIEMELYATLNLGRTNYWSFRYRLVAEDNQGNTISESLHSVDDTSLTKITIASKIKGSLSASGPIKFYIYVDPIYGSTHVQYDITAVVKKGSFVKMMMYDNLENVQTSVDVMLVHDALNVVSHAISENALSVKSEWYRTPDSHWNSGSTGGGACKVLTNGYKIRGLFTDGETKRNMPLSFKALIESLSAMDNIGWGFSTEDGETYVRVERWDWFYKNTTILTLANVNEVTTEVLTDHIPTEFKIGYKKYSTQDQYNSIDSPHGTRTFTSGIKALSNALTKECEFVADNYAIEETRRARTQKNETEESTYDENIFVFEVIRRTRDGQLSIGHTAGQAQNVGNAAELINAKLTPRHMAARWQNYLFATNNQTPFRFTSGEINYRASFSCYGSTETISGEEYQSLAPFALTAPQAENDNLTYIAARFKAEGIKFSYPLTVSQYKTIRDNPYGLIRLTDSEGNITKEGWILDFKYKFEDGMADFTLIAKNN